MAKNKTENSEIAVADEVVMNRIYMIRGKRVMLDRDLANLYGVTTGNLNKAVSRNAKRFPKDLMFLFDGFRSGHYGSNSASHLGMMMPFIVVQRALC